MCIQGDQGLPGVPGDIGFQGDKVIAFNFSTYIDNMRSYPLSQLIFKSYSSESSGSTRHCSYLLYNSETFWNRCQQNGVILKTCSSQWKNKVLSMESTVDTESDGTGSSE